jgi:hypothetical protein
VLYGGAETLAVLMGLAAAGFLLYSLWRFAGDELRHGSRARLLAVASGIVAIGLSSSLAPPAIAQWALSPAWGDIMDIALSPDGSTVALTVETRSRRQAQIWWASVPDSEPAERATVHGL